SHFLCLPDLDLNTSIERSFNQRHTTSGALAHQKGIPESSSAVSVSSIRRFASSALTPPPPPPPPPLSIWKLSQTISVLYRFSPVFLSSHERVWMRPSTKTCLPFV